MSGTQLEEFSFHFPSSHGGSHPAKQHVLYAANENTSMLRVKAGTNLLIT